MNDKLLMLTGSVLGAWVIGLVFFVADNAVALAWMAFACGALFGKGFGIWEERNQAR